VKICISGSAFDDLERIKGYYKEEGVPHIGDEFVASIFEHIQTLRDNQDIGRYGSRIWREKNKGAYSFTISHCLFEGAKFYSCG